MLTTAQAFRWRDSADSKPRSSPSEFPKQLPFALATCESSTYTRASRTKLLRSTKYSRKKVSCRNEVAYVGDDIIDLPVMRLCGLAIAVKNSRDEVLRESHYVTPTKAAKVPFATLSNTSCERREPGASDRRLHLLAQPRPSRESAIGT